MGSINYLPIKILLLGNPWFPNEGLNLISNVVGCFFAMSYGHMYMAMSHGHGVSLFLLARISQNPHCKENQRLGFWDDLFRVLGVRLFGHCLVGACCSVFEALST